MLHLLPASAPAGRCRARQARLLDLLGRIDVAQVDQHRLAHRGGQPLEVERAQRVPFGDQHHRVGALGRLVGAGAELDFGHERPRLLHALRDRSRAPSTPASSSAWTIASEGASRMSSVLGLKARPSKATVLPRGSSPSALITLRPIARLRASLTLTTASTIRSGA